MALVTRRVALRGAVPKIPFRWDTETEILSGRFMPKGGSGFTGSIEFGSPEGAFVLLEVERGTICGLEVVVWPTVEEQRHMVPPEAEPVTLSVASDAPTTGVDMMEFDAEILCFTTPDERTFHFVIGEDRDADAVRVADHLLVEVDEDGDVAGLWLLEIPPFEAPA